MKKINYYSVLLLIAMLSYASTTQAQYIAPSGNASITVEKLNEKPKTYNYPDDFPNTMFNGEQIKETPSGTLSYTDFGFTKSFDQYKDKDGNAPIVSVQMRIEPSENGTFPLTTPNMDHPYGTITIDLNTPAGPILQSAFDGSSGVITISDYPPVGGFIVGTFKATLKDAAGNTYLANGKFRVKRLKKD
ncbi:MAG TPA: hypothetical protein VIJ75_00105 [Hanamia sp.]